VREKKGTKGKSKIAINPCLPVSNGERGPVGGNSLLEPTREEQRSVPPKISLSLALSLSLSLSLALSYANPARPDTMEK
jgi:hypothetical protein